MKGRRNCVLMMVLLLGALVAPASAQIEGPVARVSTSAVSVDWSPTVEHDGLVLTVSGPDELSFRREFEAGGSPSFGLFDEKGQTLPDGTYTYELRALPRVDDSVQKELDAARAKGNNRIILELRKAGKLPPDMVQSGSFVISRGSFAPLGQMEKEQTRLRAKSEDTADEDTADESVERVVGRQKLERVSAADQVIPDDLIVQQSLCVGFDCVNNESFGFDTIRLKENNTRIKFEDTSVGTFPSNDWQLTANDSASGGSNKFSIEDITGAKVPFTVTAGASTNSIFVDSTGRVGFRTSTPVLDLHVATSNTPAMRLEQNSSGGFTAQTWDVAGNEANFFVRDVTGGSRLPFRIRPGAPTSSIDISADGDVGIGTASPDSDVHVLNSTAPAAQRTLLHLENNGGVELSLEDSSAAAGAGVTWVWQNVNAEVRITDQGDATNEMVLEQDGDLRIAGRIFTVGGSCGGGCDRVFSPDYALESIEDHAAQMWKNSYLPAVGPTHENGEWNLTEKTGGMLNELEKAHIYIAKLNEELKTRDAQLSELAARLQRLEAKLTDGD